MGVEIERKFLIKNQDFKKETVSKHYLCQAYIEGASLASVRVRIADKEAFLTIKSHAKNFTRSEFEYKIPVSDATDMLNEVCGTQVEKYRHIVWFEGNRWEIDEFLGDNTGLFVAEIELDSEDERFERPSWLGTEVTDDSRYRNSSLAKKPYAQWNV